MFCTVYSRYLENFDISKNYYFPWHYACLLCVNFNSYVAEFSLETLLCLFFFKDKIKFFRKNCRLATW